MRTSAPNVAELQGHIVVTCGSCWGKPRRSCSSPVRQVSQSTARKRSTKRGARHRRPAGVVLVRSRRQRPEWA
jgi:hypothetical protein